MTAHVESIQNCERLRGMYILNKRISTNKVLATHVKQVRLQVHLDQQLCSVICDPSAFAYLRNIQKVSGHDCEMFNVQIVVRSFDHQRQSCYCTVWFVKVASTRFEVQDLGG